MLRFETGVFSVTLDKKRKIGSFFSNCSGQEMFFQKWFYNGLFKNRGKDTSLQKLIDDGCHCRKQITPSIQQRGT